MTENENSEHVLVCDAVYEDERKLFRQGDSYVFSIPSWFVKLRRLLTMPISTSGIILRDSSGHERFYLIDLNSDSPKPKQLIVNFKQESQRKKMRAYITL